LSPEHGRIRMTGFIESQPARSSAVVVCPTEFATLQRLCINLRISVKNVKTTRRYAILQDSNRKMSLARPSYVRPLCSALVAQRIGLRWASYSPGGGSQGGFNLFGSNRRRLPTNTCVMFVPQQEAWVFILPLP
jgi:hypothetical protein